MMLACLLRCYEHRLYRTVRSSEVRSVPQPVPLGRAAENSQQLQNTQCGELEGGAGVRSKMTYTYLM